MTDNATNDKERRRTDDLRHRLAERMVPACVVLVLLIELTGKYQHGSAPGALSLRSYLVYLAIAVVLALIYAIRQRSRLRKVGPKLVFALVIVALGFAALLPGWSFGWFVAALVILGAWLAWHILLAVALELTLCVDGVGRWVEGYQTPAVIILMVELETGVLTACGSMIEAKLGNGYVTAAVIIGFVVTVMAAWLMIYRQSLSSLIRGDRLVT